MFRVKKREERLIKIYSTSSPNHISCQKFWKSMELCDFIKSLSKNDILVKLILMMPLCLSEYFGFMLPLNIPLRILISVPAIKSLDIQ